MKILLIYPTYVDENKNPVKYRKAFFPSLTLAILDRLTPDHHDVKIVNDVAEDIDFSGDYDMVGITAMTAQVERAYQIADVFRKRGIPVVIGGMHATVMPEDVKKHADSVVIGEADNIWKEVLSDCERKQLKDEYRDTELPDISTLLLPKWDNMNLGIYPRLIGDSYPQMPIHTTRGCPFGCKYCSVSRFYGKSYRVKPVANVLKEIDATKASHYFFVDDNLVFNADYARELFTELAKRNITWVAQVSSTIMNNPDLIELAAKAGCSRFFIGLESINAESLKSAKKGFNKIEIYEELIERTYRAGIVPIISMMFGFDTDTREQFAMTLDFFRKNKIYDAHFWILTPLPGTAIYEELEAEGRVLHHEWSKFDGAHAVFQPRNFNPGELEDLYWDSFQKVYSLKNISAHIMKGLAVKKGRLNNFLLRLIIHPYFRNKIISRDHPMSGGFIRQHGDRT